MWRYLKAAFLVGVEVPALGRLPVNALAAAGFFILGFGHPGFWFLGLAAEAAIVPTLAFNKRFQNVATWNESVTRFLKSIATPRPRSI